MKMPKRFAAALLLLVPGFASAQSTLSEMDCPAEPVRIAVLGDSLADGLWGSFYRAFAQCGSVDVLRRSTVSDGLAGSDAEDWLSRVSWTRRAM